MSNTAKIAIGVAVLAVVGLIVYMVMQNRPAATTTTTSGAGSTTSDAITGIGGGAVALAGAVADAAS